jgi:hypothetical protein
VREGERERERQRNDMSSSQGLCFNNIIIPPDLASIVTAVYPCIYPCIYIYIYSLPNPTSSIFQQPHTLTNSTSNSSNPLAMSSVIDKLKPHKALSHGAKLPAHALKEDNPEQATVNLHEVPGKSE